jgi:hypothetical protein
VAAPFRESCRTDSSPLSTSSAGVPPTFAQDTERSELLAMKAVMKAERSLGFEPRDVSEENRGYDIESAIPGTGRLWFIEVKGRVVGAKTVAVTKNEILTALNKPEDFFLAIVAIDSNGLATPQYVRRPFQREPDFGVTSVNYVVCACVRHLSPFGGASGNEYPDRGSERTK